MTYSTGILALGFLYATGPALPRWASFCRAYGAGENGLLKLIYSRWASSDPLMLAVKVTEWVARFGRTCAACAAPTALGLLYTTDPALPRWANFCRAYGAGENHLLKRGPCAMPTALGFLYITDPALPRWASFCRAYGARESDLLEAIYS